MGVQDDPHYKLRRSCWRKKGYRTSRDAQKKIHRTYREEHIRLYKYRCSSCDQYHVTSNSSARGKGVI